MLPNFSTNLQTIKQRQSEFTNNHKKLGQNTKLRIMRFFTQLLIAAIIPIFSWGQSLTDEIRVNQLGYYANTEKRAIVHGSSSSTFDLVDASTQETVFTGSLSAEGYWVYSNENVAIADFSSVTTEGSFYLVVSDLGKSYTFDISNDVFTDLAIGSTKAYYYQRASTSLPEQYAGTWHRNAGHPDDNVLVHASAATAERPTNTVLSAPKGWYDAGDYNKYIVNSGISTFTFLHLYETMPDYFTNIELNIPETGNNIPDILDEALWNIEWMLEMQDPNDGGVYHKLTTADFQGWDMPEDATMQRWMVQKGTAATLDFAAIMAMSARIFADFETELPGFADRCLAAARSAWDWAVANDNIPYTQSQVKADYDPDIDTGEYPDDYFKDEFSWAGAELFLTTGEQQYYDRIDIFEGEWNAFDVPSWQQVKALGLLSLITNSDRVSASDYNLYKSELFLLTNDMMSEYNSSAYKTSLGMYDWEFTWGSNAIALNHSMLLLDAHRLDDSKGYFDAALANMDYVLGKNPLNKSYVSGFGDDYPMNIHHRQSGSDGIEEPVPGFLVGGPNQWASDGVSYPQNDPATRYADVRESWATNEITINWNAPLMYAAFTIEYMQSGVTPPPPPANSAPMIVLDYPSAATSGETVNIDASGTFDSNGDAITYSWTSADITLATDGNNTNSFTAPDVATATDVSINLIASDGTDSSERTIVITINPPAVTNTPPEAVINAPASATSGEEVTVDGSGSSDADGDALTYTWLSPDGLSYASSNDVSTTFTAPAVASATDYRIRLRVNDGTENHTTTVYITINPATTSEENVDPIIVLDYTSTAQSGSTVNLNASETFDADDDVLSFSWECADGDVTFSSTTNAATSFVAPDVTETREIQITLTVSDGTTSVQRNFTVTITPAHSSSDDESPVVMVNYEINAYSGHVTTLDASESFDPEGEQVTFAWSSNEDIFLSSQTSPTISFLAPDVQESTPVNLTLTVTDDSKSSVRNIEVNVVPYKPELEEISVLSVKASGYEEDYYPENVIDNDKSTSWKIRGHEQWLVLETAKPVELSHFKLSVTNGIENNAYFDVYASRDGFDWELVMGSEESCGISADLQVFDIPATKSETTYNYFKLIGKGTTNDDVNAYSELKLYAAVDGATSSDEVSIADIVELYPNPAQFSFNLDLKEDSNVKILNMGGKVVFEQFMQQGVNPVDINLPTGTYLVQVISESQMITQQLVIQ